MRSYYLLYYTTNCTISQLVYSIKSVFFTMEKQNEEQVFIPAPHFAYIPFLLGDIGNNGCTNSVFAVALYGVGEGK